MPNHQVKSMLYLCGLKLGHGLGFETDMEFRLGLGATQCKQVEFGMGNGGFKYTSVFTDLDPNLAPT